MTKDQLDLFSRSLVGHLATNPKLRSELSASYRKGPNDAETAAIINRHVAPTPKVKAADIPALAGLVKRRFGTKRAPGFENYAMQYVHGIKFQKRT